MTDAPAEHHDLSSVRLFPLPNVVLFPRAALPLHVFEERYKAMTADALAGDRQIAMALLRPGWEKSYHARPAIEPVVCVGTIVSDEKLADGRYNFLLVGHTRARVVRELNVDDPITERLYRVAKLEPLEQSNVIEIDLADHRRRLNELFSDSPLSRACLAKQFRTMLNGSIPLPTQDIADVIAFYLLEDLQFKQQLLAENDVRRRVLQTVEALEQVASKLPRNPVYIPPATIEYSLKHPDMN
jgi:Lon protease-like protein